MNLAPLLAAGLLAAASAQPTGVVRAGNPVANHAAAAIVPAPAMSIPPAPGELAPDFTYQSREHRLQNLHDMVEQGDVLLVFAATDEQLRALERDREDLLASGVVPVAVVGRRESDVWPLVRRYDLGYSLIADPHGAIASQFGAFDTAAHQPQPAWFVVDRTRHVRATGSPTSAIRDWNTLASAALGRGGVRAASH